MGNILCPEPPDVVDETSPFLETSKRTGNPKELEINETIATTEVYSMDIQEFFPNCSTCGSKKYRPRILSKDPDIMNMKIYLCLNCKPKGVQP